jgi:hypothetical protein
MPRHGRSGLLGRRALDRCGAFPRLLIVAPPSQELEPPINPERFRSARVTILLGHHVLTRGCSYFKIGSCFSEPLIQGFFGVVPIGLGRCILLMGNGILRPETCRRVQTREADRHAKWLSQTALDHANAL